MTQKLFLTALLSISLAACSDLPKPQGKPLPDISFEHLQPIRLGGTTHIRQSFRPNVQDVGQELIIPLTALLNRYATNRFVMNDFKASAVLFDVERAAVTKKVKEGSVAGMFGGEEVYYADIVLTLSPQTPQALHKSYIISLKRELRIVQSWSLAEKEMAQMNFLEGLIQEIDKQVQLIADKNGY